MRDGIAMEDKMFDHLRGSTDPKFIKSLKELFMDFYGTMVFAMESALDHGFCHPGRSAHLFVFYVWA